MAYYRRDDWLQNAQGQALAGGRVYYCSQPANTGTVPPSPLVQVYADSIGTPASRPRQQLGIATGANALTLVCGSDSNWYAR
jgi:hypothetical protein